MMASMIRTQVQLTEAQARALKERAAREARSMADLVRESIDAYLLRTRTVDREEIRRRSIAALGSFDSGLSDIGREHDRYLEESFNE